MLNKIIKILLIVLFFSLPLVNSHFFNLIWIKWWLYVDWNYEFTKVMFFNIFSWVILALYYTNKIAKNKKIKIPIIILPIIIILIISTFFSNQPYTSLLWNNTKGHSLIMYINLIWLLILFINSEKKILKTLLYTTIISSVFVWIIWLKEFIIPTFDYWDLSNRAISTFGHPNYLALYILIIVPLINKYINKSKRIITKIFFSFTLLICIISLFLTKSAWWIFLFFNYLIYYKFDDIIIIFERIKIFKNIKARYKFFIIYFVIAFIWILITIYYYPEKIQSFISRFYIWETTVNIIISNYKNFIVWWGLWTLENVFDTFKVKELYIYENIWFTADRTHNIFLYYFYNFWIFWLFFIVYLIVKIELFYKNNIYYNIVLLFILFTLFNYPSITHYLIITMIWWIVLKKKWFSKRIKWKFIIDLIIIFIFFLWLFWFVNSLNYYLEEYHSKKNINDNANYMFIEKIKNENYINTLFKNWIDDVEKTCDFLLKYINSAENYFYCGNILWNYNKKLALYYITWLNKLPDMWNDESSFYNNYFVNIVLWLKDMIDFF